MLSASEATGLRSKLDASLTLSMTDQSFSVAWETQLP